MLKVGPSIDDRLFRIEKQDLFDLMLIKVVQEKRLIPEDAKLIRDFVNERRAETNISFGRIKVIYTHLITWRRFIGAFQKNTISDIHSGISKFENANFERKIVSPYGRSSKVFHGGKYSENSRRDYIFTLRQFYTWLIEKGFANKTITKEKIARIKKPPQNKMTKTAEQLLTEEEIKRLIEACLDSRDRALISMLYEGGFRIKELGRLTWEQVKIDEYGVVVNVNAKTGKPRYVRLIMCLQYLATWKNDYPFTINGNSPVFLTKQYKPVTYQVLYQQIQAIAKRSGISKKITPHLFRHSRITHLIQQGYQESVIKKMMWGNIATDMFNTYAHLTDFDIENEVLEKSGIKTSKTKRTKILEPRQCNGCMTINSPTSNYCSVCGQPLTEEANVEVKDSAQQIRQLLFESPKAQKMFMALIEEIKIKGIAITS